MLSLSALCPRTRALAERWDCDLVLTARGLLSKTGKRDAANLLMRFHDNGHSSLSLRSFLTVSLSITFAW